MIFALTLISRVCMVIINGQRSPDYFNSHSGTIEQKSQKILTSPT